MSTRMACISTATCLMILVGGCWPTRAADLPSYVLEQQVGLLDTRQLESVLGSLEEGLRHELPAFDLRRILSDGVLDRTDYSLDTLIRRLLGYLVREVTINTSLLGQLVVLAVACAFLRNLAMVFPAQGAAELALMVAFLSLLCLALQSFRVAVAVAASAVDSMVMIMQALIPLMTTMLAAVGAVTTATIFHPLLFTVVNLVATLTHSLILPLVIVSAILGILGTFSKEFPLKKLSGLVRQWTMTILGLLFILFFGVLAVRGAIAPVSDGIALKTAKFLTGTFVPVIGARMAEAVEVVVGSSLLIKNAIGVFGMLVVFGVAAFPALKVFSVLLIYRLATALIEPLVDERLVDAMGSMANSLSLLLACLLTVGLMFFISLTVLVGLGNIPAFVR